MTSALSEPKTDNAVDSASMDFKMVQNVLLVWLDSNVNEKDIYYKKTIIQLRRVTNTINTFMDGEKCVQFLQNIKTDKVCMIISGSFGKHIVPRIHNMSQVDSIFVFCNNKSYHEQWAKDWSKIKGVYTNIERIPDALKQSAKECEQNAVGFTVVAGGTNASKVNLDRLDPMFIYTQIVKEILLVIEFEQKHILDFTRYCRETFEADSEHQLGQVKLFEQEYRKQTPVWWYNLESFLYPMLNRAIRLLDIDVIIKLGFFIADLHQQIERLHQQQFAGANSKKLFIVYRGQGMSAGEFKKISSTKGGLIAFNNFLFTSTNEEVSMGFAQHALKDPGTVGILFAMKINPQQSTASFATVTEVAAHKDEANEILFAMHTVFRIRDIKQIDGNARLFRVELALTSDNDEDLQVLTQRVREDTFPNSQGWNRLGLTLQKLGKPKQAEQIYQLLLKEATDESKNAWLYNQLGLCKEDQEEYEEAVRFYEKSMKIHKKYFLNDSDLAASYSSIGLIYYKMNEYAKALSYHEKSLAIRQQLLPPNHPDLTVTYNNIGLVHYNMGEYTKALSYYEKVLEIRQQSLPPNHLDLASTYNNIGNVFRKMNEYAKALSYYEKVLAIQQQSLPPNHPDLSTSYNNIGYTYENMKNYSKAYSFYEKAVKIAGQSLPSNHPRRKLFKDGLDRVKNQL